MSKTVWKLFSAYGPVFLWAGLIFVFSAQSSLPGFDILFYDYVFKKSAHIFVYAVLYILLHRAANLDRPTKSQWIQPLVITFIYALLDEYHQAFTPGRFPSPIDIGYDMLGASIALLFKYRYI